MENGNVGGNHANQSTPMYFVREDEQNPKTTEINTDSSWARMSPQMFVLYS